MLNTYSLYQFNPTHLKICQLSMGSISIESNVEQFTGCCVIMIDTVHGITLMQLQLNWRSLQQCRKSFRLLLLDEVLHVTQLYHTSYSILYVIPIQELTISIAICLFTRTNYYQYSFLPNIGTVCHLEPAVASYQLNFQLNFSYKLANYYSKIINYNVTINLINFMYNWDILAP